MMRSAYEGAGSFILIMLVLVVMVVCLAGNALVNSLAAQMVNGKAAAIRAEGDRAISYANADVITQAARAVESDRIAAHPEQYRSGWPWFVAGLGLLAAGLGLAYWHERKTARAQREADWARIIALVNSGGTSFGEAEARLFEE